MPNWSRNYTAFIGPKTALDNIESAITSDDNFDFDRLAPAPEVYDTYNAPVDVLDDKEFAAEYNLEKVPSTVEEFTAFAKDFNLANGANSSGSLRKLKAMPATAYRAIRDTYGFDDWYDWRVANWGTKWTGSDADAARYHDNLLLIAYETAWTPPEGVFATLRNTYKNLHIINGSDLEGFDGGVDVTDGGVNSFHTYFTSYSSVEIEVYDEPASDSTDTDNAKRDVLLWFREECVPDKENIDALIESRVLVGEDGAIIEIDSFADTETTSQ